MELFLRILSIIVLAIVVFFLMKPIDIKLPNCLAKKKNKKFNIPINMASVPPIGVIILLAAGAITWEDLARGILGDEHLQPYAIVILFFALAYLCLSLDITGLFDYIALRSILQARGSGKFLFVVVFILSTLLTVSTSNDIVILTLTKIILSLARFMKSDPLPFLILEFFMANIWSAMLFIGNPTNIIVAEAYELSFLDYSKWMALPTIFGGFTAFGLVYLRFHKDIPETVQIPQLNPDDFLLDKTGGVIGSLCLGSCLILLLASSWIREIPIWGITITFAGILFIRDVTYDITNGRTISHANIFVDSSEFDFTKPPSRANSQKKYSIISNGVLDKDEFVEAIPEERPSIKERLLAKKKKKSERTYFVTLTVLERLPWKIVPFVLSVFIIVEALTVAGWTNDIAKGMSAAIGTENANSNAAISTFLLGTVSSLSCNVMNNQPMTILFTRVIQDGNFSVAEKPEIGSMFGLILGSNFGANLSLVSSLAGIMWAEILVQKGYHLGFFKFVGIGFTIMPAVILVSCGVIVAEIATFGYLDFEAD